MREILLVVIVVSILSAVAFSVPNERVKGTIHVLPHTGTAACKKLPAISGCSDIISFTTETSVDFFPVFFDLDEYTAVEFGVYWTGTTCTYTDCSFMGFPDAYYPITDAGGGGYTAGWNVCQQKAVCIPGFGWTYSYDQICLLPHPRAGGPSVCDCGDPCNVVVLTELARGCAGTNGVLGDDPCAIPSTEPTTWGAIKAIFR